MLGGEIANPLTTNACAEVGELILRVLLERYRPERGGMYFFRTADLAVPSDEFLAAGGFDASFDTAEDREFCDRWLQRGGALIRVPPAAVSHASPLALRGFLHRHYRYGRGAYRFHRLRRHRGSGRFGPSSSGTTSSSSRLPRLPPARRPQGRAGGPVAGMQSVRVRRRAPEPAQGPDAGRRRGVSARPLSVGIIGCGYAAGCTWRPFARSRRLG